MRRLLVLTLLFSFTLTTLTGCHSWAETDPYRPDLGGKERTVRILRADSTLLWFDDARVEGDTLFGHVGESRDVALALPLDSVSSVEYRHISTGKTVAAVWIPVSVVGLIWMAAGLDENWIWSE